jgi:hypothetical protein
MYMSSHSTDAWLRVVLVLSLFLVPTADSAAESTVILKGRVSDSSGAVVRGIRVKAVNEQNNQATTASTSENGSFEIPLPPGSYTVTITGAGFVAAIYHHVAVSSGLSQYLNVVLQVGAERGEEPPPPPPPVVTGRAFLITNEKEASGYGLYSYVLFVSIPADKSAKERDLAVIKAFLHMLSDVSDLKAAGIPVSDLNVTYLPVTERPTQELPEPDWVLSHYDFARAEALIHALGRTYVNGPYVISTLLPLSEHPSPDRFLLQDMSSVPSEVAVLWVQEFERRAAQKEFWVPATRNQAILQLRTFVANAAFAFSDVNAALSTFKSSVADWISWK